VLWIFASLNYLYCDVVSLMDSNLLRQYLTGTVNGLEIDRGFLSVPRCSSRSRSP
jgi:Family of unknown function (DUF6326)